MKLPLMGQTSRAYPSYSDILWAQQGGENFAAATESEEHGGEALDLKGRESNLAANEAVVEGSIDPVVDAHPSKKKKKKKKTPDLPRKLEQIPRMRSIGCQAVMEPLRPTEFLTGCRRVVPRI